MKINLFKDVDKFSVYINIIALILIFYDIFVVFNKDKGRGDIFGESYLFVLYFITIVYVICFIHLFSYPIFKDKIKITFLDLFPIFSFGLVVAISQEDRIAIILEATARITFRFYLIGGLIILPLNYAIHKIYFVIKNKIIKNDFRK